MKLTVVIEWPKGSRERWEWKGGAFVRTLEGLAAPVNYGFLPGIVNPADGEEVDAVVLGPPLRARARSTARLTGLVRLADGDHKLVFTPDGGRYPEDEAALLAGFEPERGAHLESADAAARWLAELTRPT
ncbi:ADP-ribosylglycohydrolase [Oceanithermus desulfurans]